MKNDASFNDAKRLYLEQYGDPTLTRDERGVRQS